MSRSRASRIGNADSISFGFQQHAGRLLHDQLNHSLQQIKRIDFHQLEKATVDRESGSRWGSLTMISSSDVHVRGPGLEWVGRGAVRDATSTCVRARRRPCQGVMGAGKARAKAKCSRPRCDKWPFVSVGSPCSVSSCDKRPLVTAREAFLPSICDKRPSVTVRRESSRLSAIKGLLSQMSRGLPPLCVINGPLSQLEGPSFSLNVTSGRSSQLDEVLTR